MAFYPIPRRLANYPTSFDGYVPMRHIHYGVSGIESPSPAIDLVELHDAIEPLP